MAFDGIDPFARQRGPFDCLLLGGLPARADRKLLRWLHRQHVQRARMRAPQPLEISPAAHLNEAARCRRAMRRAA